MKKIFAVAMTAALVLPVAATSAAAQDEKITIEGLVWLDRNGDKKQDSFESVLGDWRGVRIEKSGTDDVVGEFRTDANGRYRAELPAGKYLVTALTNGEYSPTTPLNRTVESTGTADFGIRGGYVAGRSFLDKNRDGARQADEELLSPGTLNGKQIPVSREDGQFSVEDLPYGKYKFVAADYTERGLALVEPKGTLPIDWATGTLEFTLGELEGPGPLDVMYFEPKGDGALEGTTISPAKDTYTVGEQITVKFQLLNKGDVPGKMSVVVFGLGSADAKLISLSDNVTGTMQDFETVAKIMPGKSITVEMKLELTSTELTELSPFARPFIGGFKDVDHKNQGQSFYRKIKVVAKGTATEPTTSPSETTTPTTTTTTPVVAKAGNKSGLASTGASPLGFLALGSLLLIAGAGAFFVARRRRS